MDDGRKMTLEQARKICEEIIEKHGHYCDYHEERREGEIKFVNLTLRLKICPGKKSLDKETMGMIDKWKMV
jgi:hypothetical protein